MYQEELTYVKTYLEKTNGLYTDNRSFRNRFEHTKRVLMWAKRISYGLNVDKKVLYLSVIFHDVAYGDCKNDIKKHTEIGAKIFYEYAKNRYDSSTIDKVCYCIKNHSNRSELSTSMPIELVLLIEADMLDEEGLMAFEWDSLACGNDMKKSYNDALAKHKNYLDKFLNQDPLITKKARYYWKRKQNSVKRYYKELVFDLKTE